MSLIKPIAYFQKKESVTPFVGIQRLAVTSSLYAYYDVAFTSSYSSSGQTEIFDLSNNNRTGTVSANWNYNSADGVQGSFLRLATSSNTNTVAMPTVTLSGGVTFVAAWFMNSGSYQFNGIDLFAGRDPEAYGIFIRNAAATPPNAVLPIINDVGDFTGTLSGFPSNTATSGSWHISQFSFDDASNVWNWCMDGITGSYTEAVAMTTGTITPQFNLNNPSLTNRFLNSGSIMQVMALYTSSLTTAELLQNHNSIKGRYGL